MLWLIGIVFVALGVAICSKADLGVSMIAAPTFVITEAVSPFWSGLSIGVTEYLLQGIILVILFIVIRRFNWRYLLAFAVAVLYGYVLNFFLWLLGGEPFNTIWLRWVMLIVGDVIIAFGVACFFRTYMPLQVHELFVAAVSERFKLNIARVKLIFDISLLVISVTLACTLFGDVTTFDWSTIGYSSFHSIGLGTFVTTAINSPLIALMGNLVDRIFDPTPRFEGLHTLISRK